jgi:hypothetical protein
MLHVYYRVYSYLCFGIAAKLFWDHKLMYSKMINVTFLLLGHLKCLCVRNILYIEMSMCVDPEARG